MAAAAALLCLVPAARADLAAYNQDFEALVQADPQALGNDGWKVFANVFSPDHSAYYYGYGVFPAPNNSGGFSGIDFVSGGGAQGAQDMVVYSDYNNPDHGSGNQIEANVFQEQAIAATDVGGTWVFQFDAKKGNLESPTTALAFIKTLNPAAGYATTNFLTLDTTNLAGDWATYTISITIDPALAGQLLQFGFNSTGSNYKGSGVFYDNVKFRKDTSVEARRHSWGDLKARYR
jgi:hypothetical protein